MWNSLLDEIGNTPLVEVNIANENPDVTILAKLEFTNPGGSIKDRAALYMIEHAEKSGELTPNKTVIEATSGNTGIGLALVCSVKGYKLVLTMSESVSLERRKILLARGAEIILTPSRLSTDGAIEEAYRLTRENPETYFNVDQYNNSANWMAHYQGTAKEILDQTNEQVTHLVGTLGTSGTLMGLSRKLKEENPDIQIVGVEPFMGHKIQGLKNMKESYAPGIYDKKRLDTIVNIKDEEAFEMARLLAKKGFFVGMSSGAAMVAAIKEARKIKKGVIVTIFPDSGERYLSTSLFLSEKRRGTQKFFNTFHHKKELFTPNLRGSVGIYSCGPTVHARMHVGEARRFVFSDLLCRYLEYSGYEVNHVMNITDIDDKTIEESEKAGIELKIFTEQNIVQFREDLESLSIKPAQVSPKASEHVEDMIALTEKIVNKGLAYEKFGSVYFDISRLPSYGRLSGINLDKIKNGATVDLDDYEKDNPRDFTLLKRSKLKDLKKGISYSTKWGNTVPSWHIQCPAMAMKYLSENFDIHTSGRHLIFPHHENEIAIAQAAAGKLLANYWMHCGPVTFNGKEIDEDKRYLTIPYLKEKGFSARAVRYWLLSTNYRKAISFSEERLEQGRKSLRRLDKFFQALLQVKEGKKYPETEQLILNINQEFTTAMDDDLNISVAMASLFKRIKEINTLIDLKQIDSEDAGKIAEVFKKIDMVLKVFKFQTLSWNDDTRSLIAKRELARTEKNWDLADEIRCELKLKGIEIRDLK